MRRDEIIAAIEKLQAEGITPELRKEFVVLSRSHQLGCRSRWERWTTGIGGLLISFWLVALFSVQFMVFAFINIDEFNSTVMTGIVVLVVLVEGLLYFKILAKLTPRSYVDDNGMYKRCTKCTYNLSGHESTLGDGLWVGPAVCPECGQEYPAVGE